MKINWFSPFLPDPTDIGHYSGRVLSELVKLCDVVAWTETQNVSPAKLPGVDIRHFTPDAFDYAQLGSAPIIYNLGNNGHFHAGIYRMSQRVPGVIVLHEADLHSLFTYLWLLEDKQPDKYISFLADNFGMLGEAFAKARLRGIPLDGLAHNYPITRPALDGALAVVSHTEQVTSLARSLKLPVLQSRLPYGATKVARATERSGPIVLTQFGYLNPHRRLDQIFAALGQHERKNEFQFEIFGRIWDEAYLRAEIADNGLENIVVLRGFVSEDVLDARIQRSDLVFNLRFPTIGEASGTQLRVWNNCAPSVVTDHGWFATLPDDAVLKIKPNDELAAIKKLLDHLLMDRHAFDHLGQRGKAILTDEHAPRDYATKLVHFLEDAPVWETAAAEQKTRLRAAKLSLELFKDGQR